MDGRINHPGQYFNQQALPYQQQLPLYPTPHGVQPSTMMLGAQAPYPTSHGAQPSMMTMMGAQAPYPVFTPYQPYTSKFPGQHEAQPAEQPAVRIVGQPGALQVPAMPGSGEGVVGRMQQLQVASPAGGGNAERTGRPAERRLNLNDGANAPKAGSISQAPPRSHSVIPMPQGIASAMELLHTQLLQNDELQRSKDALEDAHQAEMFKLRDALIITKAKLEYANGALIVKKKYPEKGLTPVGQAILYAEETSFPLELNREWGCNRANNWRKLYTHPCFEEFRVQLAEEAPSLKALADDEVRAAAFGQLVDHIYDSSLGANQPSFNTLAIKIVVPIPGKFDEDQRAVMRAVCRFIPIGYEQKK